MTTLYGWPWKISEFCQERFSVVTGNYYRNSDGQKPRLLAAPFTNWQSLICGESIGESIGAPLMVTEWLMDVDGIEFIHMVVLYHRRCSRWILCLLSVQRTLRHNYSFGSYIYTLFITDVCCHCNPPLFSTMLNREKSLSTKDQGLFKLQTSWYSWSPKISYLFIKFSNSVDHTHWLINISLETSCYKYLPMILKHHLPSSSPMCRPVVPQVKYQLKPPSLWWLMSHVHPFSFMFRVILLQLVPCCWGLHGVVFSWGVGKYPILGTLNIT